MEGDDVVGCHRMPFWLENRSFEREPGISHDGETLRSIDMASSRPASNLSVWSALGLVYVVWGSTYLAIAIAVQTLPPLLHAAIRFVLAGLRLAAWLAFRPVDLRVSPRLDTPRNAFVSTSYQMLAAGIVLLVVAFGRGELAHVDPATFSMRSVIAFGYLIVFGSLVAYSAYTWLLQNASVSLVSTYAFVNPVVAVVLGAVILAEPITPSIVIGAAVIVVAVAFIVARQNAARRTDRVAPAAEAAD